MAQAVRAPLAQRLLPLVLFVALATLLAAGWLELRSRALPRRASPEVADKAQPIEAWVAQAGDSSVRLSRLYPDDGRQRFESQALRERLGLAEGELFLLSRTPAAGAVAQVRDEHGLALESVRGAGEGPVQTLFRTPRGVRRGEAQEWILWGRAPHGRPELWLDGSSAGGLEATRLPRSDLRGPVAELVRERTSGKNEAARTSEGRDGKQAAAQR